MGRNPVEVAEKGASVITPSQNPGKRAKCPAWVVPLFDVELGDHIVKHFRDVMGQRRAATVLLATGYLRSKQRHWPVKFWPHLNPPNDSSAAHWYSLDFLVAQFRLHSDTSGSFWGRGTAAWEAWWGRA